MTGRWDLGDIQKGNEERTECKRKLMGGACSTMGTAKGRSRQRRAGQGDRPAEMVCCQ